MGNRKKRIKVQNKYQNLEERYQEMNEYLLDLLEEHRRTEEEVKYMHDFIHHQKMDEEYLYFKEHAHEEKESELPFPYLVL